MNVKNNLNQGLSQFRINGKIVDEPKEIANHINDFFVNVGPELDNSIPKINHISSERYLKDRNRFNFIITHISNEEVLNLIQSLPNKGTGPVSIPLKMLKDVADLVVVPLCYIIDISFSTAIFLICSKLPKLFHCIKEGQLWIQIISDPFHYYLFLIRLLRKLCIKDFTSFSKSI